MNKDVLDLISKIGKQESSLTQRTFVSPNFNNDTVTTRVEGIVYSFSVPKKEGWFKFQPINTKKARVVGPAEMDEIETYQKQLGKVRVVLVMKHQGLYMGIPDKANNFGLSFNNLMPVYLCGDYPSDFDRVITRYDGANLWYERIDSGNDPAKGDYLRECMAKVVMPKEIKFSGLTLEEKQAYILRLTFDKKFVEDQKKDTLKQDIEFAGGKFIGFVEKSDHFAITYTVEGQQFTTRVTKDPRRMVVSAGLCLNSNDHKFDLKSLVSVIREAQERRVVHVF
jgi:hypothetical protein